MFEIAPGIEIHSITDVVMKKSNVKPGALVVERTFGMLEAHSDSVDDVKIAGDAVLEYLGAKITDRLKPKIIASDLIARTNPLMSQIINRFRNAGMMIEDEALFTMEISPAAYAGYAANEAVKAANVDLIHATVFGASGKIYLSGDLSEIIAAKEAVERSLNALEGKDH